jgi:hypothetical protein
VREIDMPAPETIHGPSAERSALRSYRHFAVGIAIYVLIFQCGFLLRSIPRSIAGYGDFRTFYAAGFMVRSGEVHQLYDLQEQEKVQSRLVPARGLQAFLYPAAAALLFVPLSFLSWRAAYVVFFILNLLLLWLSARLMRESLPCLSELWPPLPLLLFFGFFPAAIALMQGQSSILLLTLYCAAFACAQRNRPLLAGILVGLAILKIQTALPVALLFLLWRRWRFLAGYLAGATACLAVSLGVTGYTVFAAYWRSLFQMAASSSGVTARFATDPAMMANLYGLAHLVTGGGAWGARLAAVASLVILAWTASRPAALPTAVIVALLLSRYLGGYDLVLLLLPLSLTLNYFAGHPQETRARAAALVCLLLVLPPVYLALMGRQHLDVLALALLALLFCFPDLHAGDSLA